MKYCYFPRYLAHKVMVMRLFTAVLFCCFYREKLLADVKINHLSDIGLGTWSGSGDRSGSDDVCVSNSDSDDYRVTASASGGGGAFELENGTTGYDLPFEVDWRDATSGSGWTSLSANTQSPLFSNAQTPLECDGASSDVASFRVIVRSNDIDDADYGSYSGTLTLVIAP
jgi:hypothetical protein